MYHGWKVVFAAFCTALFGWGLGFYGTGVLLAALEAQRGWPVRLLSSAVTEYYLVGSAAILFVGDAINRWGPRRVVLGGVGAMGLGTLAVAWAGAPWQLYGAFPLMALGWAGMSGAAINTVLAPWFDRRRGAAVSLALNGASLGGMLVAPVALFVIERLGLRMGGLAIVAAMWAVLVPILVAWLHRGPHVLGLGPDGISTSAEPSAAAPEAPLAPVPRAAFLRSPRFWTIVAPFALALTAQVGLLIHQASYLRPLLGTAGAAAAISLTGGAAVAGRLALGVVVDRLDRRLAAAGNFVVQAGAVALLVSGPGPAGLFVGWVVFGLGVGNMITLPALIVQVEFDRRVFARVVSTVTAANQFTFAFGPGVVGALREATGDYRVAFAACAAMLLLAATGVLWGRPGGPPVVSPGRS